MSSAGITQPGLWGLGILQDLFYCWAVEQFSILASAGRAAGSAPHIPADPNSLPRAGWGLALGFLGFISAVPGRKSCPGFPQGWGWEPWEMQGWGRGARRRRKINNFLKKSAKEMNQLLQGRQPELSPILLFPRRKAVAGKRGRKDFLP